MSHRYAKNARRWLLVVTMVGLLAVSLAAFVPYGCVHQFVMPTEPGVGNLGNSVTCSSLLHVTYHVDGDSVPWQATAVPLFVIVANALLSWWLWRFLGRPAR